MTDLLALSAGISINDNLILVVELSGSSLWLNRS